MFMAAAAAAITITPFLYIYQNEIYTTYRSLLVSSSYEQGENHENKDGKKIRGDRKFIILYATTTGTAKIFAHRVLQALLNAGVTNASITLKNVADYDTDNMVKEDVVIFLCSTWSEGRPPESANNFFEFINDCRYDFRVDKSIFEKIHFATFGLGGAVYGKYFCRPILEFHENFETLGGNAVLPPSLGDDATDLETKFIGWVEDLIRTLRIKSIINTTNVKGAKNVGSRIIGVRKSTNTANSAAAAQKKLNPNLLPPLHDDSDDEEEEEDRINDNFVAFDVDDSDDETKDGNLKNNGIKKSSNVKSIGGCGGDDDEMLDVEDLSISSKRMKETTSVPSAGREMVTKLQRKSLTKEGYKIIGSHSAVKLCRWTKNQMRGRGGCYKHTFYGITSYQCMEATPSLACANKCVFCWRHHKNPVGTEWRWKTDEPEYIVDEAVELHRNMINQMKGVPGVQQERLKEAFTVKHCALSLVGEPIMYPRINELVQALHNREISTFLVTNAQFPECIEKLDPVTQLYVSIDAATKDSLKAIDRPLFKDFWERFKGSLDSLRTKQQRTVYRLTLVKSWNMSEVDAYCELIETGQPDFIEIKAVTYCGKSDASSLTIQNSPWHTEVCSFSESIAERLKQRGNSVVYSIATEHEHSCCILLAREDKFKIDGVWYTWIDYPKFAQLSREYYESKGRKSFKSIDYIAPTPSWALYQSDEKGFDPIENRWRRNAKGERVEISYKSSDSGCG